MLKLPYSTGRGNLVSLASVRYQTYNLTTWQRLFGTVPVLADCKTFDPNAFAEFVNEFEFPKKAPDGSEDLKDVTKAIREGFLQVLYRDQETTCSLNGNGNTSFNKKILPRVKP